MRHMTLTRVLLTVASVCAVPAMAAAGSLDEPMVAPSVAPTTYVAPSAARNQVQFTLGAGASIGPGYFGSDETVTGPTGTFRLEGLTLGGVTYIDPAGDPYGLGVHGSLRYIGERTAEEYPELAGLTDLDASLEIGAGLTYAQPGYEVFADLRYGAIGHESFVGEVGADLILRATDRLTLSAGPRMFFGDDDYAATYFGVTPEEAAASSFSAYEAQGGLLSGGIELGAEYEITDDWGVAGVIRYDRYLGDAADSPIVLGGSDDAVSASIMATRRFSLEF